MSIQLERSESQWSRTIPDGWDFTRANRVATEHRETVSPAKIDLERIFHYSIPVIDETGDGQYENPADIKSKKLVLNGGEVLVSKLNPRKSRVLLASNHEPLSVASGEFIPLSPNTDLVLPRYLETVFLSEPARQYLDGIATSATKSHQRVSPREIREFRFPRPPVEEQRRLVSFLDRRTARIDALVSKQKRLLDLLAEKRQAFITQAVTKGLDSTVATKNTEVEWLDEIPIHWSAIKLKYLVQPHSPITYGIVQAGPDIEDGVPYIRTSDMSGDYLPRDGYKKTTAEIDEQYSRSQVRPGDLVLAIRATVGKVLTIPEYLPHANLTQGTARIRPGEQILGEYLAYLLNSPLAEQHFHALSKGATFQEVTLGMVQEFQVPVPPIKEQRDILNYIKAETNATNNLIPKTEDTIDLLKEKRQALITAAVTGQIDVTEGRGEIQDQSV